jgi:hypothetical protein
MTDLIRPPTKPVLATDPNARKEADEPELDDGEPGADENAAGFLKGTTDKPDKE